MTLSSEGSYEYTTNTNPLEGSVHSMCNMGCIYIPDTSYKQIISTICNSMTTISDPLIKMQVYGFCSTLSDGLARLQPGIDIGPLFADIVDDEAYYEWIFDNFRLGYSFHHNSSESYWFLVAKDSIQGSVRFKGDYKAGYYPSVDYSLNYIRSNA